MWWIVHRILPSCVVVTCENNYCGNFHSHSPCKYRSIIRGSSVFSPIGRSKIWRNYIKSISVGPGGPWKTSPISGPESKLQYRKWTSNVSLCLSIIVEKWEYAFICRNGDQYAGERHSVYKDEETNRSVVCWVFLWRVKMSQIIKNYQQMSNGKSILIKHRS